MKNFLSLIILLSVSMVTIAQTEVSGNQSGTWLVADSPFNVVGEIIVPSGEILSIEAGVEVNFQAYYKFIVLGNLQALGMENDSIFFTTNNPTIGWGGIRFEDADGISSLSYCRIEYGKTSGEYPDIHGGGMALVSSDAVVANCVFADNDATGEENGMGGAVYGMGTGSQDETLTRFVDCRFVRNHAYGEGGAIKFTADDNSEIINCEFIDNNCNYGGGAISLYSVYGTTITYCLFVDNYTMYSSGGAIHTLGIGNNMSFENCTMYGNSAVTGDGGAVYLAYATASFVNCIVYDNPGMYSDDIFVDIGSSAEINYSNLTMPDGASGGNNINENPQFVDAANLDFHLEETSPCIDAGTDIGYEYYGDAPDMGCYEYGLPTAIDSYENQELLIYPNPVKGVFSIKNSESMKTLKILDIDGKLMIDRKLENANKISMDISDFKNGIYIISIETESQILVSRIIKVE